MTNILVDTNIWIYALVKPKEDKFGELHSKSKEFLRSKISDQDISIFLSTYHIGEILEILRKLGVSFSTRDELLSDFQDKGFEIINLTFEMVIESYQKSKVSNIHIYDYFVAYPLKNKVEIIYSADEHFKHKDFKSIFKVENPLHPWILTEGRVPTRTEK